jgi:hypothetical protein
MIVASGQSDAPTLDEEVVSELKNKKLNEQLPPLRLEWMEFNDINAPSTVNTYYSKLI